jgi:hypothetical protein
MPDPYISNLQFTHDWNNDDAATGFVTYEPNEARVRADLQMLHDEAKAKINEIIEKVLSDGSGSIATTLAKELPFSYAGAGDVPAMDAANVYAAIVEAYVTAFSAAQATIVDGSVTYAKLADSVKAKIDNGQIVVDDEAPPAATEAYTAGQMWYDVSTHSLYVLESVLGESPYTATWQKVFPPPAQDSDDIATTDGTGSVNEKLDLPTGSTVSDALIKLASLGSGEVLKYVWEMFQNADWFGEYTWGETKTASVQDTGRSEYDWVIYYSGSVRKDSGSGTVSLVDPVSLTLRAVHFDYGGKTATFDEFTALANGVYWSVARENAPVFQKNEGDVIRYSVSRDSRTDTYVLRADATQVGYPLLSIGTISSEESTAYPDPSGWQEGIYYVKKTPEQSAHTAKMAMFQYTGTGAFGPAIPNSVSFDFTPSVIFLFGGGTERLNDSMWASGLSTTPSEGRGPNADCYGYLDHDGHTFCWYADDAQTQRSESGVTYYGIALG